MKQLAFSDGSFSPIRYIPKISSHTHFSLGYLISGFSKYLQNKSEENHTLCSWK